jgi:hypothetical protein
LFWPIFEAILTALIKDKTTLWHKRYGYFSYYSLHHLSSKNKVIGLPYNDSQYKVCKNCLLGRQNHGRFPSKSINKAPKPREKIHSDLIGLMPSPSLSGSWYVLVFTDDHS